MFSAPTTRKRGGKATKNADAISGDEEASDGEGLITEPENRDSPPRRRSGRTRRGDRAAVVEPEPTEDELDAEPITPKPRPRPRATYKPPKEPSPPKSPEPPESLRANSVTLDTEGEVNGLDTPKISRKRGRSEEEDEPVVNEGAEDEADPPADSLSNPPTPPGDIQIRRKRVRH